ncbi:hypothetical protein CWI84_11710, partial [Idiomarina tyrosinivorans]
MCSQLESLEIVFNHCLIDSEAVFLTISRTLENSGCSPVFFMDDEMVESSRLRKLLATKKAWPTEVVSGGLSFRFGLVTALEHSFLIIEEIEKPTSVPLENWVIPFLQMPAFVQAWISNKDYEYWQNAADLLQYEAVGRDHSQLPKRSNGLPPPLEQIEVDTSNNPGRFELKTGYIEAVGSTMWLSKDLLSDLGADVLSLREKNICKVEDLGRVLKIEAQEHCFQSSVGEEAELQNQLRE